MTTPVLQAENGNALTAAGPNGGVPPGRALFQTDSDNTPLSEIRQLCRKTQLLRTVSASPAGVSTSPATSTALSTSTTRRPAYFDPNTSLDIPEDYLSILTEEAESELKELSEAIAHEKGDIATVPSLPSSVALAWGSSGGPRGSIMSPSSKQTKSGAHGVAASEADSASAAGSQHEGSAIAEGDAHFSLLPFTNPDQRAKPVLRLMIEIAPGRKEPIALYQGDSCPSVALEFIRRHNLPREKVWAPLSAFLESQLAKALRDSDKEAGAMSQMDRGSCRDGGTRPGGGRTDTTCSASATSATAGPTVAIGPVLPAVGTAGIRPISPGRAGMGIYYPPAGVMVPAADPTSDATKSNRQRMTSRCGLSPSPTGHLLGTSPLHAAMQHYSLRKSPKSGTNEETKKSTPSRKVEDRPRHPTEGLTDNLLDGPTSSMKKRQQWIGDDESRWLTRGSTPSPPSGNKKVHPTPNNARTAANAAVVLTTPHRTEGKPPTSPPPQSCAIVGAAAFVNETKPSGTFRDDLKHKGTRASLLQERNGSKGAQSPFRRLGTTAEVAVVMENQRSTVSSSERKSSVKRPPLYGATPVVQRQAAATNATTKNQKRTAFGRASSSTTGGGRSPSPLPPSSRHPALAAGSSDRRPTAPRLPLHAAGEGEKTVVAGRRLFALAESQRRRTQERTERLRQEKESKELEGLDFKPKVNKYNVPGVASRIRDPPLPAGNGRRVETTLERELKQCTFRPLLQSSSTASGASRSASVQRSQSRCGTGGSTTSASPNSDGGCFRKPPALEIAAKPHPPLEVCPSTRLPLAAAESDNAARSAAKKKGVPDVVQRLHTAHTQAEERKREAREYHQRVDARSGKPFFKPQLS